MSLVKTIFMKKFTGLPTTSANAFQLTLSLAVYAKPRVSQVNVRQNLTATGRTFGFTCHTVR